MRPLLAACYFGPAQFERMAAVLRHTALKHCAGWDVRVERITPSTHHSPFGVASHTTNTQKLDWWAEVVATASDAQQILLIDGDTIVLRPLDEIWLQAFDIAYTMREPDARYPFNGGAVFLRVNDRTRLFMRAWRDQNLRLLRSPAEHQVWKRTYGGCNQAALGSLLELGTVRALRVGLFEIPCAEWNCEDSSWARELAAPGQARVLHIKSRLRHTVFRQMGADRALEPLARLWREAEKESKRLEAKSA
jgi:hypothetical protein